MLLCYGSSKLASSLSTLSLPLTLMTGSRTMRDPTILPHLSFFVCLCLSASDALVHRSLANSCRLAFSNDEQALTPHSSFVDTVQCSSSMPAARRRRRSQYRHTNHQRKSSALFSSSPNKMRFKNFDEMLEDQEQPLLVSFDARWCGPCLSMKKELKVVRDELADEVLVAHIDVEKFPSLGAKHDIRDLPCVMLFKDCKAIQRFEGAHSANEIIDEVRRCL